MALLHVERETCRNCGQRGLLRLADDAQGAPTVTWPDGTKVVVTAFRCLGCGSQDLVRRDFNRHYEKAIQNPAPGQYSPSDGLRHAIREVTHGDSAGTS